MRAGVVFWAIALVCVVHGLSASADGDSGETLGRYESWTPALGVVTMEESGAWSRIDDQGLRASPTVARSRQDRASRTPLGVGSSLDEWRSLGPAGGDVAAVATSPVSPGVALAGTRPANFNGRLYRSTDGGFTWLVVPEVNNGDIFDIEFALDGTAYVATRGSVFKSLDDGASWSELDLGIEQFDEVREIAIDPSTSDNLWAGIRGAPTNIRRSTDGGASWMDASTPVAVACQAIAVDPGDSNRVVAALGDGFTGESGVWLSTDGGASWVDRSAGLPGNPLWDILYDGARVVVAGGQSFLSWFVGVYASNDDGLTWEPLHDATWPLLVVNDIAVDPDNPDLLLAATGGTGLHVSGDGGQTWELGVGGSDGLTVNSVELTGGSGPVFLGASSSAVLQSSRLGEPFERTSEGLTELDVFSIAANPANPSELAIAFQGLNDGGVYSSLDGGEAWTLESAPPTRYNTVGFDPLGSLYALSDGPSTIAPEGLYRREPDGTWTSLGPDQGPLFESDLAAMRFSPNDPDLILLGGIDSTSPQWPGTIWRSGDAGQTWTKVYLGPIDFQRFLDIEIVEDGTDTVMLASAASSGVIREGDLLRSSDGGVTWSSSTGGLPDTMNSPALCASPSDVNTFFLADRGPFATDLIGGLHQTLDAGVTWFSTGYEDQSVLDVVCDPNDDQVLYIAQFDIAALISGDTGATFTPFDEGLESGLVVHDLAYAGGLSPRLLLGSRSAAFARDLPPVVTFELSARGSCPGLIRLQARGATPGEDVVWLQAPRGGSFIVPGGVCAGTELGLEHPRSRGRRTADAEGRARSKLVFGPASCGSYLQALDLATCTASNVLQVH